MKRIKKLKYEKDTWKNGRHISTVITTVLIVLMLAYLAVTLIGAAGLAKQTELTSDYPFEVVITAGDLKQHISELSIRTDKMLEHRSQADIELTKEEQAKLYEEIERQIDGIKKLYMGRLWDIYAIENTVNRLLEAQEEFMELCGSAGTEDKEVENYQKQKLLPLYQKAAEEIEVIVEAAKNEKVSYDQTVKELRVGTTTAAVVLMAVIIGVLLLSQYVQKWQKKELVYRSRLFDNLSMSIDDVFIILDAWSHEINYCAPNMERIMGISEADLTYIYDGFKEEAASELKRVLGDPHYPFPYEKLAEYTKPNGSVLFLNIRIYWMNNTNMPQLIVIFSDRTEKFLSKKALQDAMLAAERANMAKSDFLSRMSHEIRTPLNAIIGMTSIAAASVEDSVKIEDCLSKIKFSSKHLLMLINDILDMSKIESNKMVLQNEAFDLLQIVNELAATVYTQAKEKQIEFEAVVEGFEEDSLFVGDAMRLKQILLNLSSNAVKFTAPGGRISLKITDVISKRTADIVRFVISDTGIGMTEEMTDKIFQPFEQAGSSIAEKYGGTGLGMSIVKNLVTMMNGKIEVKSAPGKGTTYIVELPFHKDEESFEGPDFAGENLSALVVDDEKQACMQTAALLEKLKISTEWTLSGAEAVERVEREYRNGRSFDLCLIEQKLAEADGIEITRRISERIPEGAPIIMLLAYNISEIEEKARKAGVSGFLPKPLYRSAVYAAIEAMLEVKNGRLPDNIENQMPLAGRKLMVVEDNELNREIATELLQMCGASVRCANDGREALDMFRASEPGDYDAILMDVQMPVMDGHEASRRIRASEHPMADKIPIVATTANAFSDDVAAAISAGMNAHVSKPLDIRKLCEVLEKCMQEANGGG